MTGATTGEFSQLLLGFCGGALLAMAAGMLRAPRRMARWTGFLFFFTGACFAIKLWCDETHALPFELKMIIGIVAVTSVGWFWIMTSVLFCDSKHMRLSMLAAPAALFLVGIGMQFPKGPLHPLFFACFTLLQIGLAIASLVNVLRSWKDDLVESRRAVRGPFMVAVALYILSLNGFDIWGMFGTVPDWYPMFNSAMLALVTMGGAFVFLEARDELFGEADPVAPRQVEPLRTAAPAAANDEIANDIGRIPNGGASHGALNGHANGPINGHANGKHVNGHAAGSASGSANGSANGSAIALDLAAKADLDRLQCLMGKDQVWREEGLTIASLALRASMPETQLRRLICDCLGYRNFPSYVNAHRIAAAKSRLADPNEARISVSAIAYDIGFASLGPFNRAFREEAGVPPTEWRRKALGLPSPISETT